MSATQEALDSLVTKEEALKLVNHHINKAPSVMALPVFEELLKWQEKLTRWLAQERAQREQAATCGKQI